MDHDEAIEILEQLDYDPEENGYYGALDDYDFEVIIFEGEWVASVTASDDGVHPVSLCGAGSTAAEAIADMTVMTW